MSSNSATSTAPVAVTDLIMHYLKLEGVKCVFGIPGGGLINLLNTFKNNVDDFTYFICRHESGAAYIADGYYRATGKLGVVIGNHRPGRNQCTYRCYECTGRWLFNVIDLR